jgi:hypothetical protein
MVCFTYRAHMFKRPVFKFLIIFGMVISAIIVWYSPIIFKGYSAILPNSHMVIAKNLALTGKFSSESEKNVILSSERIAADGVTSAHGDKLTPILSGYLYRLAGLPSAERAAFYSAIISSLSLLFFVLIVWELFGFLAAVIFSGVYIFLPTVWITSINPNFMEYSLLFLAIGLFFLFTEKIKSIKLKYALAGLFLALSFLSRDSMAMLAPALLIWLWVYRRRMILPLFSTLIVALIAFTFIFELAYGQTSNYHFSYFRGGGETAKARDFTFYGHLYPDPYTYHYEREAYLNEIKEKMINANGIEKQNLEKRMTNVESGGISLWRHLSVAPLLFIKHFFYFISLENVGGPLIFLLALIGWLKLKIKNRPFAIFPLVWVGTAIIFMSLAALVQRNHVMDFAFVYSLLITAGILCLAEIIKEKFFAQKNHLEIRKISIFILAIVIGQLVLSGHVTLSSTYESDSALKLRAYKDKITEANTSKIDVIAAPLDNGSIYALNYLTDINVIKFDEATVNKLILENKLQSIFNEFGVTKILGFSASGTKDISRLAAVSNISDNNVTVRPSLLSVYKILLLNLIK